MKRVGSVKPSVRDRRNWGRLKWVVQVEEELPFVKCNYLECDVPSVKMSEERNGMCGRRRLK